MKGVDLRTVQELLGHKDPRDDAPLRKGGGLVDAPGRGLVGTKGEYPLRASSQTDRRDRPCDPATRRRVSSIVTGSEAARGRGGRTRRPSADEGRDASQSPERLERQGQYRHGWRAPGVVQGGQRGRHTGCGIL
jgi:hypothetical protein